MVASFESLNKLNAFSFSACNCHGHADSCVYNATVDALGLSMNMDGDMKGGGVCINCTVSIQS